MEKCKLKWKMDLQSMVQGYLAGARKKKWKLPFEGLGYTR